MESMALDIYKGKRVLLTGHTGFKGSWLALWLKHLGAQLHGYSTVAPTNPNHHDLLNLDIKSTIADIRDRQKLNSVVREFEPEIIFHLAAQRLVRLSYQEPIETLETNILGTANLLDAARLYPEVKAVVIITSDKCYENKEWIWGYRENDPMGGHDPYSVSKGCAELVTQSFTRSFFSIADYGIKHNTLVASARAGNVIGGGDWASDAIIPDIVRATTKKEKVLIRNPYATRPWQHVLEPLSGYLLLGKFLLEGKKEFAEAWNFGPGSDANLTIEELLKKAITFWSDITFQVEKNVNAPHEAKLLQIDCSKAHALLKWRPRFTADQAIRKTIEWYKAYYFQGKIISLEQLEEYLKTKSLF
jgi:CDP-glucose 4,6-dehydratase